MGGVYLALLERCEDGQKCILCRRLRPGQQARRSSFQLGANSQQLALHVRRQRACLGVVQFGFEKYSAVFDQELQHVGLGALLEVGHITGQIDKLLLELPRNQGIGYDFLTGSQQRRQVLLPGDKVFQVLRGYLRRAGAGLYAQYRGIAQRLDE